MGSEGPIEDEPFPRNVRALPETEHASLVGLGSDIHAVVMGFGLGVMFQKVSQRP